MIKYFSITILALILLKFSFYILAIFDIIILPESKKYFSDIIDLVFYGFVAYLVFNNRVDFSSRKKA